MKSNHLVDTRAIRIIGASLALISASLCFTQWFSFASAYSGMIGLNSEAVHLAAAKHKAILYFLALIGFESVATALIAGFVRMQMFESRFVSLVSRVVAALTTAILATCILVATITWIVGRIS